MLICLHILLLLFLTQDVHEQWDLDLQFAIDRRVRACQNHPSSLLIKFTKEESHNKFSFAKGESSHVREKLVIHLKNPKHPTGWITTSVDIL